MMEIWIFFAKHFEIQVASFAFALVYVEKIKDRSLFRLINNCLSPMQD